jgi:hypothetical protein
MHHHSSLQHPSSPASYHHFTEHKHLQSQLVAQLAVKGPHLYSALVIAQSK